MLYEIEYLVLRVAPRIGEGKVNILFFVVEVVTELKMVIFTVLLL